MIAGRYAVVRPLSQGGMGAIYVAEQRPLGRHVALKVLLRRHVGDPEAVRRFEKEAHAVSRLLHPHIVTLFDFGQGEGGELFIAMELLKGRDLRTVLEAERRLPWRRALHVVKGIVSALVEAHSHGIIHRDLKPENVMLVDTSGDADFVKVLDFGLARSIGGEVPGRQVTQQDLVAGTPTYLAPERIEGVGDDPRSDLYAVGAMWFELLTGRFPYEAPSAIQVLLAHMQSPVPSPIAVAPDAAIPPAMDALIVELLAKRPDERPPTAAALHARIAALDDADAWRADARARTVPPQFADEAASMLDEGRFAIAAPAWSPPPDEDEREPDPIPLVRVKRAPVYVAPAEDDEPIELVARKRDPTRPAAAPPLAVRPKVVTSIAEAATLLGSARDARDVAAACVAFLASRFDRVLVVDVREAPRLLGATGAPALADLGALLGAAQGLLADASSGRIVYGPARSGGGWEAWHARLSGRPPGGVLVGALSLDGLPALLVYADHDRRDLYTDLKDVARLLREAAASLGVVSS